MNLWSRERERMRRDAKKTVLSWPVLSTLCAAMLREKICFGVIKK